MTPKYKQIAQALRRQILENTYPPGSLLPTEQQLHESFSASRQTVRQALQCLVDEGLITRRQGSGSRVVDLLHSSGAPRRTVAIITTYIGEYIFPGILREAESVLSTNNCTTMLFATSNQVSSERRILQDLLNEKKVDGILVEGTKTTLPNPNLDLYRALQAKGIPLIFLHGKYEGLEGAVSVLDDNYAGGRQLVDYLVKKGHRHIAGIFKSDDIQGHQRYAGFTAALRDHGIAVEDRNIFWYRTEDKDELLHDENLWREKLIPLLKPNTAVVCYNDEVAGFAIQSLLRNGIRIPEEIAIVSFDNSIYSNLSACRITSLSHGNNNAGRIAAEALIQIFQGKPVTSTTIPWTLIEKESS